MKNVDNLTAPELLAISRFFAKKAENKNAKWKISDDLDEGDYEGDIDLSQVIAETDKNSV